jgi:hypothetical protein
MFADVMLALRQYAPEELSHDHWQPHADDDLQRAFEDLMGIVTKIAPWRWARERELHPFRLGDGAPLGHLCVLGDRLQRPGFAFFRNREDHRRFLAELTTRRTRSLPRGPALIGLCTSPMPRGEPMPILVRADGALEPAIGPDAELAVFLAFLLTLTHDERRPPSDRYAHIRIDDPPRGRSPRMIHVDPPVDVLAS